VGVDEALYVSAAGAINTTGQMGSFGMPPQSMNWRGQVCFEAVPVGATGGTGALTVDVVVSLDGGVTFQKLTGQTGLALFTAGAGSVVRADLSGLGGNGQIALNATTVTIGTSTGFNIYAHLG